jgi:uncharacterized membrane protein
MIGSGSTPWWAGEPYHVLYSVSNGVMAWERCWKAWSHHKRDRPRHGQAIRVSWVAESASPFEGRIHVDS